MVVVVVGHVDAADEEEEEENPVAMVTRIIYELFTTENPSSPFESLL